jgi:hypothetical protein
MVRLTAVALLALALAVTACGGGDKGVVPSIAEARAERDERDGVPGLTSTITVRFDRPTTITRKDVPLASNFDLDVPDLTKASDRATKRVQVREASIDGRNVILKVDLLVPDETTVRVAKRAFRKGEPGELEAKVTSDLAPLQALMASAALVIADPAILDDTSKPVASAADRDAAAIRGTLEEHLTRRGASGSTIQSALQRYDALPPAVIPSPKLRAALAALTGTFADSAIENLMTANNCTGRPIAKLAFQEPEAGLFAQVTHERDGARVLSIRPDLEGERLEKLMALITHEAIHCDPDGSLVEEIVATALDTVMYMSLLFVTPEMARDGTSLTRDFNVDAVAMINSGRALPESIGLLPSPGVRQALAGTNAPFPSFADLVASAYVGNAPRSATEPLAQAYVILLARAAGTEAPNAFDLEGLDALLARFVDPRLQVAIIQLLGLQPG